ncbi:hypothetical protein H0B56_02945 [Haloechinothrix sp. YIM 98757]|uniref:Uncharacterized protein n=1 Tax=Haloechinothrix aidingensis TaxID=2752311 RepID=A0A837ZWJ3_9PSEU|nr:hypothetical protein [Haloechinothrix aidingensis]MBA0124494.1 hypothetical protein [Haloechinothrix aidingensis]
MPFPSLGRSRGRNKNPTDSDERRQEAPTTDNERVTDHELEGYIAALAGEPVAGEDAAPSGDDEEPATDPGLHMRDAPPMQLRLAPAATAQLAAIAGERGVSAETLVRGWVLDRLSWESYGATGSPQR